jgi:malate dehydrogenase
MERISIIGSGNVGANAAFFIAETGIARVNLFDSTEGQATGKSLDMMETAPIRKYRNLIHSIDSIDEMAGSEIIIVAAGNGGKEGVDQSQLYKANAPVITDIAKRIGEKSSDSIVIVASEPVDALTTLFVRESGMDRTRVIGLGGCIDSTRFRYAIARSLTISAENVTALVIGRHAEDMICLPHYTSVSGVPLSSLVDKEGISSLIKETCSAGNLILELAHRNSAYYAPSAAAAEVADAIHMDLRRIISVSVQLDGEYGVTGVALSLPCIIGKNGIERVLTPELSEQDTNRLLDSSKTVKKMMESN